MLPGVFKIICGLLWAVITLTFALDDGQLLSDFYLFQTAFGIYVVFDGWTDVLQASAYQRLEAQTESDPPLPEEPTEAEERLQTALQAIVEQARDLGR